MRDEQIRDLAKRHADDAMVGTDAFVRARVRVALESAIREALESSEDQAAQDQNSGQFVVINLGEHATDHQARIDANRSPTHIHLNKAEAIFEARRLAARNPGSTFAVFQRIGQAAVPEQKAKFKKFVFGQNFGRLSRLLGLHLGSKSKTAAPDDPTAPPSGKGTWFHHPS